MSLVAFCKMQPLDHSSLATYRECWTSTELEGGVMMLWAEHRLCMQKVPASGPGKHLQWSFPCPETLESHSWSLPIGLSSVDHWSDSML